jgi:formylglycine-generating enzyme required for sulfatase activity
MRALCFCGALLTAIAVRAEPPRAVAPFDGAQARKHQEAWAAHLGTSVELTNTQGMKLVLIPPGEFLMGSTGEAIQRALTAATEQRIGADRQQIPTEAPQHRVVLTKPFRLSATEVTVGQFRRFVESAGYKPETERLGGGNTHRRTAPKEYVYDPALGYAAPGYPVTDDSPVTQVTWNDAAAFCEWLTKAEYVGVPPSGGSSGPAKAGTPTKYRLPTEAEWEFACRAGTTTEYSCGDDLDVLHDYAWYLNTSKDQAAPVGTKRPNPFGLFDIHGNTREWCADWYDPKWYRNSPLEDPQGPATGETRVLRGGKWLNKPAYLRSAYRFDMWPTYRSRFFGFRVACEVPQLADQQK